MAESRIRVLHFARNLGGRTLAASTSLWGTPSVTAHAKSTSLEPKRRRSGDFVDTCPDCGSIITGETADEVLGAACACQQGREIRYLAELSCMSCGRQVGTITAERPNAKIMIPREMRCQVCGGPPVVNDVFTVSTYPDLPQIKQRLGRPPGPHPHGT